MGAPHCRTPHGLRAVGLGGLSAALLLTAPSGVAAPPPECGPEAAVDVLDHTVELDLELRPPALRGQGELQARGVTYSRGALVLHRLRNELGDAAFWDGVRRYVRAQAGRGARSEDLRRALEAASGRPLGAFFARWVYAPAPDL